MRYDISVCLAVVIVCDQGVVPYLWASAILNYRYIVTKTNEFIVAVL